MAFRYTPLFLKIRGLNPFRVSKKWLNATFLSFFGFRLSHSLPGGKTRKVRKPKGFIRSDVHTVRAGLNIRGCGPLSTPGFIDRLGLSPPLFVKFLNFFEYTAETRAKALHMC